MLSHARGGRGANKYAPVITIVVVRFTAIFSIFFFSRIHCAFSQVGLSALSNAFSDSAVFAEPTTRTSIIIIIFVSFFLNFFVYSFFFFLN